MVKKRKKKKTSSVVVVENDSSINNNEGDESSSVTMENIDDNTMNTMEKNYDVRSALVRHVMPVRLPLERVEMSVSKMSVVGLLLFVIGVGVFMRSYLVISWTFMYSYDGLGIALMGVGAGMFAVFRASGGSDDDDDGDGGGEDDDADDDDEDISESFERIRFRFTPLNGYYRPPVKELFQLGDKLAGDCTPEVKALFKKHAQEEKLKKKEDTKSREEALLSTIKEELENGCSIREIVQKRRRFVYVLEFNGDLRASQVGFLRQAITMLLQVASSYDEVVIRMTSPGGLVQEYGHAASQLVRLRKANIKVTVCVDTVAASGGYLMAVVANRVIAAPFAYIGSIGVVATVPNFRRILDSTLKVDVHEMTAGKHKRTLSMFGEVTDDRREHFQDQLNQVHRAFIQHVSEYRKHLDLDSVCTGDVWLAIDALEKNLIDGIMTSDEYLGMRMNENANVVLISQKTASNKGSWLSWIFKLFGMSWILESATTTPALTTSPVPGNNIL